MGKGGPSNWFSINRNQVLGAVIYIHTSWESFLLALEASDSMLHPSIHL